MGDLNTGLKIPLYECIRYVASQRGPILRTSASSVPPSLSTLSKGDISTLENRGHFYFGLTLN